MRRVGKFNPRWPIAKGRTSMAPQKLGWPGGSSASPIAISNPCGGECVLPRRRSEGARRRFGSTACTDIPAIRGVSKETGRGPSNTQVQEEGLPGPAASSCQERSENVPRWRRDRPLRWAPRPTSMPGRRADSSHSNAARSQSRRRRPVLPSWRSWRAKEPSTAYPTVPYSPTPPPGWTSTGADGRSPTR